MDKDQDTVSSVSQKEQRRRRPVLWTILGAVLLLLGVGAFYLHSILNRPRALFEETVSVTATPAATMAPAFDIEEYLPTTAPSATAAPVVEVTIAPQPEATEQALPATAQPTAEPTAQATVQETTPQATPEETLQPTASGTLQEQPFTGIVNIALFGIDASEDGGTTSGTMPHTDADMIVAVNFDTKEVSLISIARDAFTNIPGYDGFYKFNAVFNVGGGMADPKAGLELSCRTAEMWLGGMSVPYYYGVDFQALIDLVDALGGIDFNVDVPMTALDTGAEIPTGQHHLDGWGVLAYLRARKSAGGQDHMRTARQRKMMIALFRKLKEEGQLSMIPDLMKIMGENVYTNTTVAQTAALMNFAQSIDPDSVQSYGFFGGMYSRYDWRFCFIFQQDRIDILKKVYGIDAEPLGVNSPMYEQFLHNGGFLALQHIGYAKRLFDSIHGSISTENMTEEQKRLYATCWKDYTDLQEAFELASSWTKRHYDENEKLSVEEQQAKSQYYHAMLALEERLRSSGDALNEAFGSPTELKWFRDINDWYKPGSVINEVYVDFA